MSFPIKTALAVLLLCVTAGAAAAQFSLKDLKKKAENAAAEQVEKVVKGTPDPAPSVAKPVAAEPVAAETVAAAPVGTGSGTDPIVADCKAEYAANRLFDCSCLGGQAQGARANWVKARVESNNRFLERRKSELSYLEKSYAAETDPAKRENLRKAADAKRDEVKKLETPPDPMAATWTDLSLEMTRQTACRKRNPLETEEVQNCKKGNFPSVSEAESVCTCVGKKVADRWMSGEHLIYSQSSSISEATAARLACAH